MINKIARTLLLSFFLISFLSCTKETEESASEDTQITELPDDGIEIRDAWARPGRLNGVSAIYMNVLNGSSQTDTLLSLSSPAAGLVEVHETYEQEEGMMGMREAENLTFPAQSSTKLEPGGLHVMLMQLNSELEEGDEIELTIQFAGAGEVVVNVPVQETD